MDLVLFNVALYDGAAYRRMRRGQVRCDVFEQFPYSMPRDEVPDVISTMKVTNMDIASYGDSR